MALAAEIADGWLPLFFSPKADAFYRAALAEGFARHSLADFEVAALVPVIVGDDVEQAADSVRPFLALYIGGMGAKGANFHRDVFARLGYEEVCEKVQERYLAGRKAEAIAAIPTALVEQVALVGPVAKIRDELAAWKETVITTLLVQGDAELLSSIVEAVS